MSASATNLTVTEVDIRVWCPDCIAKSLRLRHDRVDDDADFASYGLDPAVSVFVVTALYDWLGLELASEMALDHPSVSQIARFLMDQLPAPRSGDNR